MMRQRLIKKPLQVYLKTLYLRNFRNYSEAEVSFSENLNVILGDNAQGKTNLLEAIYLIATGRSFRTQTLSDLIQEGKPFFFLEAEIIREGVSERVKVSFDGKNKSSQLGSNIYPSFHPLLGILPSVLYTPYDIELIAGSPTERRRFLNLHLAQSDPLYVHHLTRFWRAMKQRNCLLRAKSSGSLECWEIEMVKAAEYIKEARTNMIQELKEPLLKQGICLTSTRETCEIQLSISASKNYLEQLQRNRAKEMDLGLTLTGPHRDDFSILIDSKAAKLFASEGQKKTAVTAIRLAEWERLTARIGNSALMAFDDLGIHLDDTRTKLLKALLGKLGQVFVTTPHSSDEEGHHIHIQAGSASF